MTTADLFRKALREVRDRTAAACAVTARAEIDRAAADARREVLAVLGEAVLKGVNGGGLSDRTADEWAEVEYDEALDGFHPERIVKADRSHLVRKVIQNKLGRRQVVWVKPSEGGKAGADRPAGDTSTEKTPLTREQVADARTKLAQAVANPNSLSHEQVRRLADSIDAVTKDEAKGLLRQLGAKVGGQQVEVARRLLEAIRAGRESGKGLGDALQRAGNKVSGQYGSWGQAAGGGEKPASRDEFPKRGVSATTVKPEDKPDANASAEREQVRGPKPAKPMPPDTAVRHHLDELVTESYGHSRVVPVKELAAAAGLDEAEVNRRLFEMEKAGEVRVDDDTGAVTPTRSFRPPPAADRPPRPEPPPDEDIRSAVMGYLKDSPDAGRGLITIAALRRHVADTLGPAAASHRVLNAVLNKLDLDGDVRLTEIDDRSRATKEDLAGGMPASSGHLFYLSPTARTQEAWDEEAKGPAASGGGKPPDTPFTGTDSLGREWRDGELVAKVEDAPKPTPKTREQLDYLPKDPKRLTVDQRDKALADLGYTDVRQVGGDSGSPNDDGVVVATGPDGKEIELNDAQVKTLLYGESALPVAGRMGMDDLNTAFKRSGRGRLLGPAKTGPNGKPLSWRVRDADGREAVLSDDEVRQAVVEAGLARRGGASDKGPKAGEAVNTGLPAGFKLSAGADAADVGGRLKALFGDGADNYRRLGLVAGVPDGAEAAVTVTPHSDGRSLDVVAEGDGWAFRRIVKVGAGGEKYVINKQIAVSPEKAGSGVGTALFAGQVKAAQEAGFSHIQCTAGGDGPAMANWLRKARADFPGVNTPGDVADRPGGKEWLDRPGNKPMNGYYTWARLGYDQPLYKPDGEPFYDFTEAAKRFPNAKSVQDIMSTAEGREWWKQNGQEMSEAQFDLTPGSRSLRVLEAYRAAKASSSTPPRKTPSTGRGAPSTPTGDGQASPTQPAETAVQRRKKDILDRAAKIPVRDDMYDGRGSNPKDTWLKYGGTRYLDFDTLDGRTYMVEAGEAYNLPLGGDENARVVLFRDKGSQRDGYKITGTGQAHEIFGKVTAALTSLVANTDPPALFFAAAEPSRAKLYDRLVSSLGATVPGYTAFSVDTPDGGRKYMLVKPRYEAAAKRHLQKQATAGAERPATGPATVKPVQLKSLSPELAAVTLRLNPEWFGLTAWD